MKVEYITAKNLKPLGELYPREDPDDLYVATLIEALKSGAELPPLLVDGATKRVVDGLHRLQALRQLRGPDAAVPVILKYYQSQEDLFLDAVAANSKHGRGYGHRDRARCLMLAERMKIEPDRIATALSVTTVGLRGIRLTAAAMKPGASANKHQRHVVKRSEARRPELADQGAGAERVKVFGVEVGEQQSPAVRASHYAVSLAALLESGQITSSHLRQVEGSFKRLTAALRKLYGIEAAA